MITAHAYDPEYLTFDHRNKIREPLTFAPVESRESRNQHTQTGGVLNVHMPQAQRCQRCKALLAVGHSFEDHIFFCKRVEGVQP